MWIRGRDVDKGLGKLGTVLDIDIEEGGGGWISLTKDIIVVDSSGLGHGEDTSKGKEGLQLHFERVDRR